MTIWHLPDTQIIEPEFPEVGKCDHCGEHGVKVMVDTDPFINEVYPEDQNQPLYWCRRCYFDALGDV